MGRFGDDPHAFFRQVYSDVAPWEVGGAQPDMARMLEDYPPADPVLDLGSATGDLAITLALQGHDVVGLEFVQSAVDQAREKAAALAPEVSARLRFEVGDATRPSALGIGFGSVLDSGFIHLFDLEETDRFVADLRDAIAPGGRYYLHEFAIEFPIENVPRAITEEEIRARFNTDAGWRVLDVRPAVFHNRVAQPTPAIVACIERLAEGDFPPGIGAPARRALINAGYSSLGQLTAVRESELRQLHGMGPKAIEQLRAALQSRGRSFKSE